MELEKQNVVRRQAAKASKGDGKISSKKRGSTLKRGRTLDDSSDEDSGGGKKSKLSNTHAARTDKKRRQTDEDSDEDEPKFRQSSLITGAKLKDYQLEGVKWMISLDKNGVSGILADEMGLGKTLQTIAFHAYLRENRNQKPFLIVCPLSVLHNWVAEFNKFAPSIPVVMYHGSPEERATLRKTVMNPAHTASNGTKGRPRNKAKLENFFVKKNKPTPSKPRGRRSKPKGKTGAKPRAEAAAPSRRSGRLKKEVKYDESDDEVEVEGVEVEEEKPNENLNDDPLDSLDEPVSLENEAEVNEDGVEEADEDDEIEMSTFPVIVTTYEIIIRDRVHLEKYSWGYIVVDEGHRLKNLDCKLMREIKKYRSAGRMILTGTPLHNNLAELWSLLNFILPDIFGDLEYFQKWFNIPELQDSRPESETTSLIESLHTILKPFLLRRLKVDVETDLPPKKEYVLYAPLTERQRELYDCIVKGGLRKFLLKDGGADIDDDNDGNDSNVNEEETKRLKKKKSKKELSIVLDDGPLRTRGYGKISSVNYAIEDDNQYFAELESGELAEKSRVRQQEKRDAELEQLGRDHIKKTVLKKVNNMRLQNTIMQLRKVCSHPFLFDWPVDPETRQPVLNDDLVDASGKMMVLERLLDDLFKRGHKVLLFSQFTTMLDIIEDWAIEYKKWRICRIDGSSSPLERRDQMDKFQTAGDAPDAPRLFLLSTRSGGLGINLVAADTVIFYDQDWNPQMDAQAQDRAHRIGQTKPVLIFRLMSAHTIETKILQRASEKRKLEALVIAKGKFKMPGQSAKGKGKTESMAEMAAELLKLEGEKINVVPNTKAGKAGVLKDEDLNMLLDRRPEVFAHRGKGWAAGTAAGSKIVTEGRKGSSRGKEAAFEVFEAATDEGNDALAKMFGEDVE